MDINFQCTKCGDCCRGMWIGLSVEEATSWLDDGNTVQVFCEAVPWLSEVPAGDLGAAYKKERSFPAMSGNMPIRVIVTLVAPQGSRCPNLSDENTCRIYHRRPVICRIYPAEKIPFVALSPDQRKCPEEAWKNASAPYMKGGSYVDEELLHDLRLGVQRPVDELPLMASLCRILSINDASLSNEGYVVHTPSAEDLKRALCQSGTEGIENSREWRFVSDQAATSKAIVDCGGLSKPIEMLAENGMAYLSLLHR